MKLSYNTSSNVARVDAPSVEEFTSLYAEPGKPVLISGVVSNWPAYSLWNQKYFNSIAGDRLIPVKRMRNGDYLEAANELMKLSEYLNIVSKKQTGEDRFYLSEQPVKRVLPEVVADYSKPTYIESDDPLAVCYIGSHVHSQMHFHPYGKALLCVVSGRKRVKLFAPDQTQFLYQKYNFSKITEEPVDLEKYPLYANANYYECEVNAGEMLFFPIYWWHGVDTQEFTSAVVFFWNDSRRLRWSPPPGIPWHTPLLFEIASWYFKGKAILRKLANYQDGN
ncbi:cupin-like domain-containing protein [Methylomonas rivi]|uniref:Cupin-like domain-containing protein n=1 Tax=Methylomonas rivi TaxID=2952226 RepID=A0ABT1U7F8_9GAMM|nr:cupin-like domain-containing protein [Methylomonas sp. WSC-6]MCQ8129797.1 cupin-like domain-containing protein [Methylomonas sp. WSC-6]